MNWKEFHGDRQPSNVDLSTPSAASSSSLLSSIRAERLAREHQRHLERSATTIQRVWRGRNATARYREELLVRLETGSATIEQGAKVLLFLLASSHERARVATVVQQWCVAAQTVDGTASSKFASLLAVPGNAVPVALLVVRILRFVSDGPQSETSASLLDSLEAFLKPSALAPVSNETRYEFIETLARQGWVETCVQILEHFVAASQPKKKHPLLQPVVRLVTAPLAVVPLQQCPAFIPPLLQRLLSVQALPSVIPLPSLTHLSSTLPLFSVIMPVAAKKEELLSQDRLATELGKTCLLANLATFGITGGMLARQGADGLSSWMRVVGTVLSALDEGWLRWAEASIAGKDTVVAAAAMDIDSSDDEDERTDRRRRTPLPANVASKLNLLASPTHIAALVSVATGPRATGHLVDFSRFILSILLAFRGSPRWESTLDTLLDGKRGQALVKLLWREGARGKWSSTPESWTSFAQNPLRPILLLLSHIYCHYLLITPDDEFFSYASNPLTLDEVKDLSLIWRDLAFWGYMNGVAEPQKRGVGTEDERALFTRGLTRITERNGRRRFAPDGFWVMDQDLKGFVAAVEYEEAELEGSSRMMTRRQLAAVAPRIGLLNNLPMSIPFDTRVEVFRAFVQADSKRVGGSANPGYFWGRGNRHEVEIRREHLAEDAFRRLNPLGSKLKELVQITFINKWGNAEPGIDGGGLIKELLHYLCKEAFDTNRGLWLANDNNELYPNPHSYASEDHQLQWFTFLGRILGKAIYSDILVDVKFAGFFLAKWLGRQSYLDDLASLDKDLYRGLVSLKNYPDPEELSLNFTMTEDDFGVTRSVDLVPGGSDIAVTAANRHEYIQLVCKYKLGRQFAAQSNAFFSGLSDLIDPRWIRMFDQNELAQLVGGEETPIDIADLRKNTSVSGFDGSSTPQMFWNVVAGFNQDQRRDLIRFVTSVSRPPLLGFAQLMPKFGIRNAGTDTDRLPTASACANLLKLPDYQDERVLKMKLLQAITSGAGFDMS